MQAKLCNYHSTFYYTQALARIYVQEMHCIINTDCTFSSQAVKDRAPVEENEKYHWNMQKGLQMSLVSNACANY